MIKAVIFLILLLLKIIGVLLLLGLVLFACLLFVPVRYSIEGQTSRADEPAELPEEMKSGRFQFKIRVNVSWFLHLIRYTFDYGSSGMSGSIRIFGLDVQKLSAKWNSRKRKKRQKEQRQQESISKPDIDMDGQEETAASEDISVNAIQVLPENTNSKKTVLKETDSEKLDPGEATPGKLALKETDPEKLDLEETDPEKPDSEETDLGKPDSEKINSEKAGLEKTNQKKKNARKKKAVKKKKDVPKKKNEQQNRQQKEGNSKKGHGTSIRSRLQSFHKEFTDHANRQAAAHLWKELLFLLRSFKPRKIKADLVFSLADPAYTGYLLGVLSMFPGLYKYPCHIVPDFHSQDIYVEGELFAKGKITVVMFLVSLFRLWRDKEFKHVFNRVTGRG